MGRLDGRVAVVTGASRGFGRATAVRLASEGADILLGYRSGGDLAQDVAREIGHLGRRALAVGADLADPAEACRFADTAIALFGRVDILVNNAGVMHVAPFETQSPTAWDRMLAVNVLAMLHVTQVLLPHLKRSPAGRIINLASQLGHVGGENFAVYSGTKAFVLAFTRSLAREVGPAGVTVNAVCPGSIVTDMNRTLYPPERQAQRAAELPLRRMGDPADVAGAVLYLASDDASFVTGQCIDVNGGSTMV